MIDMNLDEEKKTYGLDIRDSCLWISSEYWGLEIGSVMEDKDGGINSFDYVIHDRHSSSFFVAMKLKSPEGERLEEISLLSIQSKNVGASRYFAISGKEFTKREKSLTGILHIERVKAIMYDGKEMIVIEDMDLKKEYNNLRIKKRENPKNHRRDRSKIMIDILSLTRQEEGAGITKIIYKCNLNYRAALSFIEEMKDRGLIQMLENEFKQKRYTITGEGLKTLSELVRLSKYLHTE